MCIYIHNEILLSLEKNEIKPFAATGMDLEIIILSEVSQKEKDKHHMLSLTCGIYNTTQTNISMKQKQTPDIESRLVVAGVVGGSVGGGKDWEFGISR